MAEYFTNSQMPYIPKVYRIKTAPFTNPFVSTSQETLVSPINALKQKEAIIKAGQQRRASAPAKKKGRQKAKAVYPSFRMPQIKAADLAPFLEAISAATTKTVSAFHNLSKISTASIAKQPKPAARTKKRRRRSSKLSAPYVIALSLCLTVFAFSALQFAQEYIPQWKADRELESLRRSFTTETGTAGASSQNNGEKSERLLPNMEETKAINSDFIGWIYLDGCDIDHPIVQSDDNIYYLTHSFLKKSYSNGSVFLDYENASNFSDQNTVIYAHSMKSGAMFGKLKYYKKQSVYEQDPVISIYTLNGEYHYQIFAVCTLAAYFNYRMPDYGDEFLTHINDLRSKSVISSSAKIGKDSKIITLSTCTSASTETEDLRLVVCGVLLNPDGKPFDYKSVKP